MKIWYVRNIMVVAYLEKIRNKYIEEKVNISTQLNECISRKKENNEFMRLLEKNNDLNFEVFTPRTVNSFNKTKINELIEEQKIIEQNIDKLKDELNYIEKEINEVSEVISIAKEKMM